MSRGCSSGDWEGGPACTAGALSPATRGEDRTSPIGDPLYLAPWTHRAPQRGGRPGKTPPSSCRDPTAVPRPRNGSGNVQGRDKEQVQEAAGHNRSLAELWESLPPHLQAKIVVGYLPASDVRRWRLSCKEWSQAICSSVRSMKPAPRPGIPSSGAELAVKFPSLKSLDLYSVGTDVGCGMPLQILTGRGQDNRHWRRDTTAHSPPITPAAAVAGRCTERLLCGLEVLPLDQLSLEGAAGIQDSALGPLSCLTGLTKLSLAGADGLSGSGLTSLAPLSALEQLSLSGCRGLGESALEHLQPLAGNLKALMLERCLTTDNAAAASVSLLTSLESLSLRGCRLTDEGLSCLRPLQRLQCLNLQGLPLTSAALGHFSHLTGLADLNLHGIALTDGGLGLLTALTGLTKLNMRWVEDLTGVNLVHVTRLPALRDLCLDRCRGLVATDISSISGITSLTSLCLARCPAVNDYALAHVASIEGLQSLDLDGCQSEGLQGASLSAVAALTNLQRLSMKGCKNLQDCHVACLAAATSLKYLDFSWCQQLHGPGPAHLHALPGLKHLSVSFCRQLVQLPERCQALDSLDMAGCTSLVNPSALGSLTGLTSLNMEEMDVDNVDDWALAVSRLTRLTTLNLSECEELSDNGLAALAGLSSLTYLSLRGCCEIGDEGLAGLLQGPVGRSLAVLCLEGVHNLTDDGLDAVARGASSLRMLRLSGCEGVSGPGVRRSTQAAAALVVLDLTGCDILEDDAELMAMAFPHGNMKIRPGQQYPDADIEEMMVPLLDI